MIQRKHRMHPRVHGERHFKAMMEDDNKNNEKDSDDDKDASSSDDSDKEKYSDKEQLVALMLALFLGSLGIGLLLCSLGLDIHRFVQSEEAKNRYRRNQNE